MAFDPSAAFGAGIGITNSLINAIKGIEQVRDGKKLQRKLDALGRPVLETPEAFNEVEGLVRSNYLDPRLAGEDRLKDEIKARGANQIQNIQDTAGSGADALTAYGLANANTDNSLFNVDMKAYEQQQNDYNKLLATLGQKADYEGKQFDFNVVQPFMQSAEQAKALIAAGEQNRNNAFNDVAGYATNGFGGLGDLFGGKNGGGASTGTATPTSNFPVIKNDIFQSGLNTAANTGAAGSVVNSANIGQLQQLLQLIGSNPSFAN